MKYETAKAKADRFLKEGDALGKTNPAESRRLLRKCRRYRMKQKEIRRTNGPVKME